MAGEIALLLITCERYDYTRRALESFSEYNDVGDFIAIHADDASTDNRVIPLAQEYGFELTLPSSHRLGCHLNQRRAVEKAKEMGAEYVLMFQNDWEWKRPLPWDLFRYAFSFDDVYCMRLFGIFKEEGDRRCGVGHAGKGRKRVDWKLCADAPEHAEIGDIHWTHTPTVTKTDMAWWLMSKTNNEREALRLSGKTNLQTIRPMNNVLSHFGK